MKLETKKAILLFFLLFLTWQVLWFVAGLGLNTLLGYTAVFAVLVVFLALDGQKARGLGLTRPRYWKRYVAAGFVLAVAFVSYMFALGPALSQGNPELSEPLISSVGYGVLSVPYVGVVALAVGLVEETSFRGYILRNLRKSYSDGRAILYSSILFGAYHISILGIYLSARPLSQTVTYWTSITLFAFVWGLFLGYFYVNTEQTTIGPITCHSGSIFIQSFVPFSVAFIFTVGHLLTTIPVIVFIILLILLKRKGWLGIPGKTAELGHEAV